MSDVLIIEDDEDIRQTAVEFLAMEGVSAVGCENGQAGVEHLAGRMHDLPKLIIVDLNMPVMNGYAFLAARAANPALKDIPCVVMTANNKSFERDRELGVVESLNKPMDLDRLIAIVHRFVGR